MSGLAVLSLVGTPAGQAVKTSCEGKLWTRIIQGTQAINGFPCGSTVKNPPAILEPPVIQVQSLDWENPLEEGMATHSSILTWRIPRTGEPDGLQSIGSKESDTTEAMHRQSIQKLWEEVSISIFHSSLIPSQ